MAEQIISASGVQYPLIINPDGSINTSTGATSAGSQTWVQNTVSVTPSGAFNVVVSGLDVSIGSVVLQLEDIYIRSGNNIHLGSAWTNIGSVVVSNFPIYYPGSSWIATDLTQIGSLSIQTVTGSVNQNTNPWIVLGSVNVNNQSYLGSLTWEQNIGSTSYIPAGSVIVTNVVSVSGNLGVIFDNDYLSVIQSGTNWSVSGTVNIGIGSVNIASIPSFIGSVNVTNFAQIGSFTTQTIDGTVTVNNLATAGSLSYQNIIASGTSNVVGSIYISNLSETGSTSNQYVTGSINIATSPVVIVGSIATTNIGSVIQSTNPWIVLGSVAVSNNQVWAGIGSTLISNFPTYFPGSSYQATSPWTVSGNVLVSGTVIVASPATIGSFTTMSLGSVAVSNFPSTQQINGSIYSLLITPTLVSSNPLLQLKYVYSGTAAGVTGSKIGSIFKIIGGTTYTQVLSYADNVLTQVGSWV